MSYCPSDTDSGRRNETTAHKYIIIALTHLLQLPAICIPLRGQAKTDSLAVVRGKVMHAREGCFPVRVLRKTATEHAARMRAAQAIDRIFMPLLVVCMHAFGGGGEIVDSVPGYLQRAERQQ